MTMNNVTDPWKMLLLQRYSQLEEKYFGSHNSTRKAAILDGLDRIIASSDKPEITVFPRTERATHLQYLEEISDPKMRAVVHEELEQGDLNTIFVNAFRPHGSVALAAKLTGIPDVTIRSWKSRTKVPYTYASAKVLHYLIASGLYRPKSIMP